MAKAVLNLIMTFDGYVAGPHDEIDWIGASAAANAKSGDASSGWDMSAFTSKVGAIIVGNRSYELGVQQGWFKEQAYGPSPIFVLCEKAPEDPSKDADFRFVTDGIDAIHQQAVEAAGDKWVYLFGGPSVFQQFLNKDLVDEMHLTIAPILIGKGIRLFDNLTERHILLENLKTTEKQGMIEVIYRIVK